MYKIVTTEYGVRIPRLSRSLKIAVVADLHSRESTDVGKIIGALKAEKPNIILMPGDIFERLDGSCSEGNEAGFELMREAGKIAPTFYSVGNHENGGTRSWNKIKWCRIKSIPKYYDPTELARITECGVTALDDGYTVYDGIAFGGLSSGLINEKRAPDVSWLDDFCSLDLPKILLCHHPEYYKKYLRGRDIDLIVSGHAHGGQWRFFGRGVFAPGQGIFPKYTSGTHDGKFVISRGLKPSGKIPRIFNTPEVVFINVN